ncbi:hypothetical protein [Tabrizicola sp. BL-A-41-H6]
MKFTLIAALLALAACGADGPPEKPTRSTTPAPGVQITGEARVGVVSN